MPKRSVKVMGGPVSTGGLSRTDGLVLIGRKDNCDKHIDKVSVCTILSRRWEGRRESKCGEDHT